MKKLSCRTELMIVYLDKIQKMNRIIYLTANKILIILVYPINFRTNINLFIYL